MNKERKMELLKRQLGLRHKLKVHDSMKMPDTHEDIAVMTLARWDFEDEIAAIDELLHEGRKHNIGVKREQLRKEYLNEAVPPKKSKSKA